MYRCHRFVWPNLVCRVLPYTASSLRIQPNIPTRPKMGKHIQIYIYIYIYIYMFSTYMHILYIWLYKVSYLLFCFAYVLLIVLYVMESGCQLKSGRLRSWVQKTERLKFLWIFNVITIVSHSVAKHWIHIMYTIILFPYPLIPIAILLPYYTCSQICCSPPRHSHPPA